jgi:hypothetical protein|tara:strand:- start:19 stop:414 length:396 start_codon:yes stop_codon:yes gene_type:complete
MSPRKNRPSDRTSQDSVKNIFERYEISKDDKHMIDCAVKSYMAGRARVTREPGKERTYSTDELQRLYPEYYTKFSKGKLKFFGDTASDVIEKYLKSKEIPINDKRWFELARCVIVIGEDKVLKFQNRVGKT